MEQGASARWAPLRLHQSSARRSYQESLAFSLRRTRGSWFPWHRVPLTSCFRQGLWFANCTGVCDNAGVFLDIAGHDGVRSNAAVSTNLNRSKNLRASSDIDVATNLRRVRAIAGFSNGYLLKY